MMLKSEPPSTCEFGNRLFDDDQKGIRRDSSSLICVLEEGGFGHRDRSTQGEHWVKMEAETWVTHLHTKKVKDSLQTPKG